MKTRLLAGIGSGLAVSLLVVGGLFVSLGAAKPFKAPVAEAERVSFCHLQKKVDPGLLYNDGRVITVSKAACRAHCAHGDQPMLNLSCARIHVIEGLPSCEVNTPATSVCSEAQCIAFCEAS